MIDRIIIRIDSGKLYGNRYLLECNQCHKHFFIMGGRFRGGVGKFCSHECWGRYRGTGIFGEKHAAWKGGRRHNSDGYIYLRINGKDVLEHRKIMQDFLGRVINPREHVHHKNGVRDDNRLENLELMNIRNHMSYERKIKPFRKDVITGKFIHN